ncbi:MAG TPA: lysophospholipid acyltransferase family protein [Candidatus Paceibacterota bacterium]|nr:lysophospholipid acyltransferase family protein [Candidatus Pacearchaeota archaeon]HRZ51294.1 lysophospholipid acyltransferase family protein [Candidatus Paceibacterota bacterium]HSA37016.1 lysophospholipid acyltransferase family protein [Candidatus Paceibacterota bacterium]
MKKIVSVLSWILLAPLYHLMVKEVKGKENIPKGNFILASNHSSHLDWFINGYFCTPRRFTFIGQVDKMTGAAAFWRDRLYDYSEVIPMNRKDPESRKQALIEAAERLRQGSILIIYPEGTRTRDGKLHEFKPGVARLHFETGVPILPVALKGTYELMPPGGKLKIKKSVTVIVGKPLDLEKERNAAAKLDKSSDEYRGLCLDVAKLAENSMQQLLNN